MMSLVGTLWGFVCFYVANTSAILLQRGGKNKRSKTKLGSWQGWELHNLGGELAKGLHFPTSWALSVPEASIPRCGAPLKRRLSPHCWGADPGSKTQVGSPPLCPGIFSSRRPRASDSTFFERPLICLLPLSGLSVSKPWFPRAYDGNEKLIRP